MPADVEIIPEPATRLADYARIPIAFEVTHRLSVDPAGPSSDGISLRLERQDPPYVKDYDAIDGCHPTQWPERHDVSDWWIASAWQEAERVGGVVVAFDAELAGMRDAGDNAAAVLWDLRVAPGRRRRGVGARLFGAAIQHAREQGSQRLLIETQNTNVTACRFYAAQGCTLVHVEAHAYPLFPNEVRLVWAKELGGSPRDCSVV